ncbi:tripartite tricarboxylate transporter TctB family protein [Agrobacterium radiobacter]|uniref:tripartite tricarboxylate transporter TctB family protein n=1 Tax=Agrobacterium radiobacter TaxID=362 RepID=UPI003CE552F4
MENSSVKYSRHNVIAGGIFIGIAALFIVQSSSYDFGTALQMGPGFFPIVLAVTLSIFGMLILIDGLRKPPEPVDGAVPWRGLILVCLALAVFGAGARSLGLIPVVFLCTFMAAQASRKNAPLSALVSAFVMSVLCYVIFKIGLAVSLPTFGPALGF